MLQQRQYAKNVHAEVEEGEKEENMVLRGGEELDRSEKSGQNVLPFFI